jgi:hypothetical protein
MHFLPPQLAEHVRSGVANRIALTIEEDLPPRQRQRRIVFWLYGDGGRRIQGFGITEKPQPDPGPEK